MTTYKDAQIFRTLTEAVHKEIIGNDDLSNRESYIVYLFVKERFSIKQIASKLFISPDTVVSHLRTIYRKLDIHCQTDLIVWYYANFFKKR